MIALADMRGNMMTAGLLLVGGVLFVLFLSRRKRGGSAAARWVPWVSLIAGPLLGLGYWAVETNFIRPEHYPHPTDSTRLLTAVLFLGAFAGCTASLVFGTALHLRRRQEDRSR